DVKLINEEENLSNEIATKPLVVSIIQSPTAPSLPPRNRFPFISKIIRNPLLIHVYIKDIDAKMMKGKEKMSNEASRRPSVISITQSPTLPSLPPRNRSDTISIRFGANESQWGR
ncbi:hypothetical protein Goklo_011550, partial [Gossypium klotzschianum]|nr:hypothetical protein [Gossypium klotzschianum]